MALAASLHVDPGICTDLAVTREAAGGRRSGASSHCECDGSTEERRKALHDPPDVRGDESVEEIDKILAARCKLLTFVAPVILARSRSCAVPWDHDWVKGI